MHLNQLPGPSRLVSWVCCENAISGVLCVSSGELISGCDPPGDVNCPGSQEDLGSNWELLTVEDAVSGPEFAPCLPALAVARLPPCLWWGMG